MGGGLATDCSLHLDSSSVLSPSDHLSTPALKVTLPREAFPAPPPRLPRLDEIPRCVLSHHPVLSSTAAFPRACDDKLALALLV